MGVGEYGLCIGKLTYFPNGTSDPSLSALQGGLAQWVTSITYSATGVQTIVFSPGFAFAGTPRFYIQPACTDLASSFEVSQIGAYNATTRTLVLQQRQATTGYAAAAAATCFVSFVVFASDSQGK
jgi:hypothetical protein